MNNSNTNEKSPKSLEISKMKKARRAAAAIFIGATGGALAVNAINSDDTPKESNPITTEAPAPTTTEAPVTSITKAPELIPPIAIEKNEDGTISEVPLGEQSGEEEVTVVVPPMPETQITGPDGEVLGSVASGQVIQRTPPTSPGN